MEGCCSLHPFYTNNGILFQLQAAAGKIHSLGGDTAGIKESTLKMLEGNLVGIVIEMSKSSADTQLSPLYDKDVSLSPVLGPNSPVPPPHPKN